VEIDAKPDHEPYGRTAYYHKCHRMPKDLFEVLGFGITPAKVLPPDVQYIRIEHP
jgi:hypothetical protein